MGGTHEENAVGSQTPRASKPAGTCTCCTSDHTNPTPDVHHQRGTVLRPAPGRGHLHTSLRPWLASAVAARTPARTGEVVPFAEAARAWFLISLQTFGGPAGQIAVMQRTLVEERRWIGQQRFLHALNYCMLLPGPEAQQLATYVGWLLNGTRGGLVAGGLFVLPGMV